MKLLKELLLLREQANTVDETSSVEQLIHAKHEVTHKLRKLAGRSGRNKKDLEDELTRLNHLIAVKRIHHSAAAQK
jgi:predicted nucleic acid-binding protein